MNRDEVVALLRLRYQLCEQRFSDETVDAWHEVLAPNDAQNTRETLLNLTREGHSKVALSALIERSGVHRPAPPAMNPDALFLYASARINAYKAAEQSIQPGLSDDDVVSDERMKQWVQDIRREINRRNPS